MSETGAETPAATLGRLISGAQVARMISVAAELGIADLLEGGPRTCDELAAVTETHPLSLFRLLRALASVGIFAEEPDVRFRLTPLADLLRAGAAGSLRGLALFQNDEWYWQVYRELPFSVRTGMPATEHLWGNGLFGYFASHPEAAELFDRGMASRHAETNAALASAYDFSDIRTLVDVGGGNGSLLATILASHPSMNGILFDLPRVVESALGRLARLGLAQRCRVVGGDFFDSVPAGGDAYVLSNVLHDWQDEQAAVILRAVRRAMGGHGRLLVVNEQVIPPGNAPHPGKLGDITMLLIGGRERTEAEWRHLFAARLPPTDPDQAAMTALAEYAVLVSLLRSLDCARYRGASTWRAARRGLPAHVHPPCANGAVSVRERGLLDGMNAAQINDRRGWSGVRLVAELARLALIGVTGRRRVPGFVRKMHPPPNPPMPPGACMNYVFDVIYTRDAWMHRVDISPVDPPMLCTK